VREHFDTLGRHITNAKNKYDEPRRHSRGSRARSRDVAGAASSPRSPASELPRVRQANPARGHRRGGARPVVSSEPDGYLAAPARSYGINILVKLLEEGPGGVRIYCPKGSPIRYGVVAGRGDGFDEGANAFR
jgi:hypothetical protein